MAVTLLLVPVTLCVYVRCLNDALSSIPSPTIARLTNIVLKYHWLTGNQMKYIHSLHGKYGIPNAINITDLPAVKEIHRIGTPFMKSPFYRTLTRHNIKNLFNTSDPKFHSTRQRLLKSGTVDIFQWWMFMAMDIIRVMCFGDSFQMLELGKKNQYCQDLEAVSSTEAVRVAFPRLVNWAGMSPVPIPYFQNSAKAGACMEEYTVQSVQRYKRLVSSGGIKETFFTRLLATQSKKDEGLSDKDITDEAISFIIASSDTTANTLTYQESLLNELSMLPDPFTDNELRPLSFLNNVITETLRLYSGIPSSLPQVSDLDTTLAKYRIPAGTTVTTQAYSLHRDADIYNEPERFNPSRWESPSKEMKDAFMPFGGGVRTCLGAHLAKMELRLATARFFKQFPEAKLDEKMDMKEMEQVAYFLLAPRGKRCLIRE
ncbi:cytochrome P450 [Aspergillus spectabilis]